MPRPATRAELLAEIRRLERRILELRVRLERTLERDLDIYAAHVGRGERLRPLGRRFGVAASTVLRIVRSVEEMIDDPEIRARLDQRCPGWDGR